MEKGKVFYKKRLFPVESGLAVTTEKWISIHETKCFHFCIHDRNLGFIEYLNHKGETGLQKARRLKLLKRVSKDCSRFAFETEDEALEHLRFLKRKQKVHMTRDLAFIERFLAAESLVSDSGMELVPNSKDLVGHHFIFD